MKNNGFTCSICGKFFGSDDEPSSAVTIDPVNGVTEHDGYRLNLNLCKSCTRWMLDGLPEKSGKWEWKDAEAEKERARKT